jgi:hypothetical protein
MSGAVERIEKNLQDDKRKDSKTTSIIILSISMRS